jgi:hypothetical protein
MKSIQLFRTFVLTLIGLLIGIFFIFLFPDLFGLFLFSVISIWGLFHLSLYAYQLKETVIDTELQVNIALERIMKMEQELNYFRNFYEGFNQHLLRFEEHVNKHEITQPPPIQVLAKQESH